MVWFLSLSEGKKCGIPQPITDLGYFASATFGLLRWNTGSVSGVKRPLAEVMKVLADRV